MRNKKMSVNYFTTFVSANGNKHWAVHSYDNITKTVRMMKDLIFEDIGHKDANSTSDNASLSGRFYVINDNNGTYKVIDSEINELVAIFFDKSDADEFCDIRNGHDLYSQAVEDFSE